MPPRAVALARATPASTQAADHSSPLQRWRRSAQGAFFLLFLLAPALNLLRFDLNETQLWFLGMRWSLGIDDFVAGKTTASDIGLSITLRAIVPLVAAVTVFLTIAYRWGRLYCGWLCPHFSVVESLNRLMHKASGKFSLWDSRPTPRAGTQPDARYWAVFALACGLMGFVWAITLLTYLLPPAEVWGNLLRGELTINQTRFLAAATLIFTLEFTLARHLFCRFGCAVGYFQSVAWMANPRAMVVAFSRDRARECRQCDQPRGSACDSACPMRLNPRNIKRMMFSCVQCGQCISACGKSQSEQQRTSTLEWKVGLDALRETLHQRRHEAREKH